MIDHDIEPWHNEPDDETWTEASTGYVCRIRRNDTMYHLCGYVRVPSDHPLHGVDYGDPLPESISELADDLKEQQIGKRSPIDLFIYAGTGEATAGLLFDVHGSVTFTGGFRDDTEPTWWIGFDCGHAGDFQPGMRIQMAQVAKFYRDRGENDRAAESERRWAFLDEGNVYRTFAYVKAETERLAQQLHAIDLYGRVVALEDAEARKATAELLTTLRKEPEWKRLT